LPTSRQPEPEQARAVLADRLAQQELKPLPPEKPCWWPLPVEALATLKISSESRALALA
jgi:hypothetical protein